MKLRRAEAQTWNWQRTQHANPDAAATVREIIDAVKTRGDEAVKRYTVQFDRVQAAAAQDWSLRVSETVMQEAWKRLPADLQTALTMARERIYRFHSLQRRDELTFTDEDGAKLGLVFRPLERVGVYAPGGRAAYPSTVLMNIIPAQVAGVKEVVLVSPPTADTGLPHELVLAAAHLCGVKEFYRMGGAQAIAALAYGTGTLRPVHKVVGPGNLYVALAKRQVMGDVGIDSIAGPSEVFIVADDSANPDFVAADMIAQAEHDPEAGAVCITTNKVLPDLLDDALTRQLAELPRQSITEQALQKWGAVVVVDKLEEAFPLVNASAPEHVELLVEDAPSWLDWVTNAGAVFLGPWSPEPVGDYYAGTNHVLPTHGSARFASGLGVDDFVRRMTYVEYGEDTLLAHMNHIAQLAFAEGLTGHAQSVLIRRDYSSRFTEGARDQ